MWGKINIYASVDNHEEKKNNYVENSHSKLETSRKIKRKGNS